MTQPQDSTIPTTLWVCPTSHLDWDWNTDFEQYYAIGLSGSNDPVHYTFDQLFDLLEGAPTSFRFSLAEMGYLRRYFIDTPGAAREVLAASHALCLMGGGVTSPDDLVSHGEAFIRNYLLGVRWLTSLGIDGSRDPLAWLPDDFGHDPQLPVVLAAMGMQAVGLSRVPGSWQGTPDAIPVEGCTDPSCQGCTGHDCDCSQCAGCSESCASVACQLKCSKGLVFPWVAADGSQVLGHFMPQTYSVSSSSLSSFVDTWDAAVWGGPNMFVPVPSGDFATPTSQIQADVDAYNRGRSADQPAAVLGTFQQFVSAVLGDPGTLPPALTLRASNYWTGFFASRPQLKIDHYAAVRDLLAAEATSALLRVCATVSTSVLDALDASIEDTWWSVARSTHHDFITGTSPDQTYRLEQRPLSAQMRAQARACRTRALVLLGDCVAAEPAASQVPVVVFNSLGQQRGGLVSLATKEGSQLHGRSFSGVYVQGQLQPIQVAHDGRLLLPIASVPSLGYDTVYLQPGAAPQAPEAPALTDALTFDNGVLTVTFSRTSGWAITSLFDRVQGQELIAAGGVGNELRIYEDSGNLYQFGNEPIYDQAGVLSYGTFRCSSVVDVVRSATVLEYGPLRFVLQVVLEDTQGNGYDVRYTLVKDEPFVRIRVRAAAPSSDCSVVTAFDFASSGAPDGLVHGTAYHWDDVEPIRYWWGPTFQSTHDYLLPTVAGTPIAAIYHGGVPAWCRDQGEQNEPPPGTVLGVLLRSASGQQRGAAGTDPDPHTQHFAVGIGGAAGLDPTTTAPLANALSFSTPLRSALPSAPTSLSTMPESSSLAGVTRGTGMIRAVRVQPGSAGVAPPTNPYTDDGVPTSFVLRAYVPTNQPETLTLDLPFESAQQPIDASLVTALEQPIVAEGLPQPPSSVSATGSTVTLQAGTALTTVRIQTRRVYVTPTNGKSG